MKLMKIKNRAAGEGTKPPSRDKAMAIREGGLLRRDQHIRFERGGPVYATDGLVGSLRQVVVDVATAEVTAIVVLVASTSRSAVVPLDVVDRAAGSAIFLKMSRHQFHDRVQHAAPYDKHRFAKINAKALLGRVWSSTQGEGQNRVFRVGRHFVETPIAPLSNRPGPQQPLPGEVAA